jgi:hypothetical protein
MMLGGALFRPVPLLATCHHFVSFLILLFCFADITNSRYAIHVLDWVFECPIFKSSDFVNSSDIPKVTARRVLIVLWGGGIIKELQASRRRRAAIFAYPELLNIAGGVMCFKARLDTVFRG